MNTPSSARIQGWAIIVGAAIIFAAVVSAIVWDVVRPPPVVFLGIERVGSPVVAGEMFEVEYNVERRPVADDCTNGFQVDIFDANREPTRMPVPARGIAESISIYKIVVPDTTVPGEYDLRVRETVYCRGGPEIVDAPWVPIEILEASK